MVKEAEAHREEDMKRKELIEAKNQAEALIHSTEKTLKELGEKVAEAAKSAVESAIEALKKVIEGDDTEEIKAKTTELAQAAMQLGEQAYKGEQAEGGAAGGEQASSGSTTAGDEDVVDADFEEVDDDKKS